MSALEKRSKPTVRLEYGKLGTQAVDDLAQHLRTAGFDVVVPNEPSTDTHLLSATAGIANVIEAWLPAIEQGLIAAFVWDVVKWGISQARKMIQAGDSTALRVRVNPDEPSEIIIGVQNTGVWKSERVPLDERALPPRPSVTPDVSRRKAVRSPPKAPTRAKKRAHNGRKRKE